MPFSSFVLKIQPVTRGIPTVASHVLPRVALDAVSWSSYDGSLSHAGKYLKSLLDRAGGKRAS